MIAPYAGFAIALGAMLWVLLPLLTPRRAGGASFCTECGARLESAASFCAECGAPAAR